MQLIITALYFLFVAAAVVLVVVVLLQEGKGGGLTDALGASGKQTFGVAASGINKFTGFTGGIFLVSALAIHYVNRVDANSSTMFPEANQTAPLNGGDHGTTSTGGAADLGTNKPR